MGLLGNLGGMLGAGWLRDEARAGLIGPQGQFVDDLALRQMAQPQLNALQQQMSNQYYQTYITTADSTACGGTVTLAYDDLQPLRAKRPESSLEWLDRRVNEMRVAL